MHSTSTADFFKNCEITDYDEENDELEAENNIEEKHRCRALHFEVLQFHHYIRQRRMEVEVTLCKMEERLIHGAWVLELGKS